MASHSFPIHTWALFNIAMILGLSIGVAVVCRRLKQPVVVGELLVGIVLGPSLLGNGVDSPTSHAFPMTVRPILDAIAQLGVVLFASFAAMEMDRGAMRHAGRRPCGWLLVVPSLHSSSEQSSVLWSRLMLVRDRQDDGSCSHFSSALPCR